MKTGSITPIIATDAPTPDISESVRKKQPIGTPALPMAATTEMKSQSSITGSESSMPPFCITKSDVTKMNAAQPFMLMVVQIGSTKRATLLSTPRRSSDVCIVTGSVAAELLVNRAMSTAGIMRRITCTGLSPRAMRNSGSTTKNCSRLPLSITATYLPIEATTVPADTSAESCAANATMPTGSTVMSQRMSRDTTSCNADSPRMSNCLLSPSGILASASPTATAMSSTESTLPSMNGRRKLSGTIPIMYFRYDPSATSAGTASPKVLLRTMSMGRLSGEMMM